MAGVGFENARGIAYVEQEDGSTLARKFDYIAPRSASGNELHEAAIRAAYSEVINPKTGRRFEYQNLGIKNNAEVFPSDEGSRVTRSADVTEYNIRVKFKHNTEYKSDTAYMEKGDWISARVTSFNGGKYGTADIGLSAVIE